MDIIINVLNFYLQISETRSISYWGHIVYIILKHVGEKISTFSINQKISSQKRRHETT